MKILKTLVAAAGLVFAAACSDTSNQMTGIDPTFSKVGKGGYGDPHFTTDMVCTYNDQTEKLACDYQIVGLSSLSSGVVNLVGIIPVSYACADYPGTTKDYFASSVAIEASVTYYADKSGVAKGEVVAENPLFVGFCLPKLINFQLYFSNPSQVEFGTLNQYATNFLATKPGEWSLSATVTTPKGVLHYIYFTGLWVPEVVIE
jgi:hypothetical protein